MLNGEIHPDFGEVATILSKMLPRGEPGGGAVCVYHHGEPVVDIWGGTRDEAGNPWERDTLALSYSTTKGVLATLLHVYVDRGLLDYDDPVAKHWPEFEASGKQDICVRHLLCHEAGLYDIRNTIDDASRMLDWDYMVRALARAAPAHRPGAAHAYHGLTFGWLVGELLQRVGKARLRDLLERDLAQPLALDGSYIGVPESELHRVAQLIGHAAHSTEHEPPRSADRKPSWPRRINRWLQALRFPYDFECFAAALMPRGIQRFDWNRREVLCASIPAANGVFTARALARVYAALANGGSLGHNALISKATLERATRIQNGGLDRVVPLPMRWRLGYHRVLALWPRMPEAFGHFGLGGSGGMADPRRNLSVAFVTNFGTGTPFGDLRIARVAQAAARCVDRR